MILWSYIARRIFIERDKIDPVLYPPAPHVIFAASLDYVLIISHIGDYIKRFGRFFCTFGGYFFRKSREFRNDATCPICSCIL